MKIIIQILILTITFTKTAAEQIKSGVKRIFTISPMLSECIIEGTIAAPITVIIKPIIQRAVIVINLVVIDAVLYLFCYLFSNNNRSWT